MPSIGRTLILAFGLVSYSLSMANIVYAAGFIGGFLTPTQLDEPRQMPLANALLINFGLLVVFAVQHSGMARPAFKQRLTRVLPKEIERSTYCLMSSLALMLLFWLWQPLGGTIWEVNDPTLRVVAYSFYGVGWIVVLSTTFLINHFDLFGLRQTWLAFRAVPYTSPEFVTPWPYRLVRHPLYVGWLMVFWFAPTMTVSHLIFALGTTMYILAAIRWEERDLIVAHPEYAAYTRRVPKLLPRLLAHKGGNRKTNVGI